MNMRGLDFSPYRRSTVGFDRLFDYLENSSRAEQDNYPPFDIEKLSDDSYRITLAVAGFKRDDLDITAQQNMLVISGRRSESRNRDGNFLHVGIATRAFERRFELADFVRVTGAELRDGLLSIDLVREIPEAMKPRKIDIGSGEAEALRSEPAAAESDGARVEQGQTA
ncbi:Hsp20 family protein [Sphingosinicella sp. CPCC 101087]|uniref:Hsp20 family protein n=1 Tax=Sphingosinicella sp. CPCC 101087 TaxID=2497754 RepID=UPI002739A631|nr:Hsp20 family protein [Sphingosinicella sp. CPCC 101087]